MKKLRLAVLSLFVMGFVLVGQGSAFASYNYSESSSRQARSTETRPSSAKSTYVAKYTPDAQIVRQAADELQWKNPGLSKRLAELAERLNA